MNKVLLILSLLASLNSKGQSIFMLTATASSSGLSNRIDINLYDGTIPYANAQWNNWNVRLGGYNPSLNHPAYENGIASVFVVDFNDTVFIQDNGSGYPGALLPQEVMRFGATRPASAQIRFENLNPAKTYDIEFFCSSNTSNGSTTQFTIGSPTDQFFTAPSVKSVVTDNNQSTIVTYTGLTPVSYGLILVKWENTVGNCYLNAIRITEH